MAASLSSRLTPTSRIPRVVVILLCASSIPLFLTCGIKFLGNLSLDISPPSDSLAALADADYDAAFPAQSRGEKDAYLRDVVSIEKDVEGLNHRYRYSLYHNIRTIDNDAGKKCVLPCTPLAVIKIMEYLGAYDRTRPVGHQLDGKVAVVFNRSEVVGRPLAAMLANDGATVYSIDISGMLVYAAARTTQPARAVAAANPPPTAAHRRAMCEGAVVLSEERTLRSSSRSLGPARGALSSCTTGLLQVDNNHF